MCGIAALLSHLRQSVITITGHSDIPAIPEAYQLPVLQDNYHYFTDSLVYLPDLLLPERRLSRVD